jgi:hypothetical protein
MPSSTNAKALLLAGGLGAGFIGIAQSAELNFADYNNQGLFNDFSGDSGQFANGHSVIFTAFDTQVFHGSNGAALRIDYAVPTGFCGVWNSLIGKASYPEHALNFTNLYGSLLNSAGNPSRVENVQVTNFSFWARGDGKGNFDHRLKVELKSTTDLVTNALFSIPNVTNWTRCNFAINTSGTTGMSRMKEINFVLEDWENSNRAASVYLDDLAFTTDEPPADPARWSNDAMLDVVSQRSFSYFLRFTDGLGFALDRSSFADMVSVGTIGFQLTAYCIGHQRGWADKAELESRIVTILKNLSEVPMGPDGGTVCGGYHGFYYHFLAANTGRRKDEHVELSLYDTTLLMYGVLTCQEYFPTNTQIQELSRKLFDRVEWDWFVDHARGRNRHQFHLAWTPGPTAKGTFQKHVDGQTDEALMVDVLALGSKTHPVEMETYFARNRVFGTYPPASTEAIMTSWRGSLFNYFFASCWLDFESRGFDLHPEHPQNIWRNNQRAIAANRQFCIDHASAQSGGTNGNYSTYGDTSWGLTACDSLVRPGPGATSEYFAFGALPTEENVRFGTLALQAGTIAVYGAASSINFTPNESLAALRHYFEIPNLWSPLFGFGDAFSLDPHYIDAPYDAQGNPTIRYTDALNGPWVNTVTMGINIGPMLLAMENYRSGQIWKMTSKNPVIAAGLNRIFGVGTPAVNVVSTEQSGGRTNVILEWNPEPGASKYSIFASPDSENWTLLKSEITETNWTASPKAARFFLVKALP